MRRLTCALHVHEGVLPIKDCYVCGLQGAASGSTGCVIGQFCRYAGVAVVKLGNFSPGCDAQWPSGCRICCDMAYCVSMSWVTKFAG